MKKIIIISCMFIFSLSLYSQNIKTKSYHENGEVKEVLSFNEKEQLDGICIYYDLDGDVLAVASYKDGKKNGEWKIWREDGTIAYEMYYSNGEKTGVWKQYNEKGELIKERDFS